MEWLMLPLFFVSVGFFVWIADGGPQSITRQLRYRAEANARAEESKLERIRLERNNN